MSFAEHRDHSARERWRHAIRVSAVMALVAAALLGSQLMAADVMAGLERDVLDRFDASRGAALDGLTTSPALLEWLRFSTLASLGVPVGLRALGVLTGVGFVMLATLMGARLGGRVATGVTAGCVVMACPSWWYGSLVGGAEGIGALASAGLIFGVLVSHEVDAWNTPRRRGLALIVAAALLGVAIASDGVLLGGALPAGVAALIPASPRAEGVARTHRHLRPLLAMAAAGLAVLGLSLIVVQGDGYLPVLAAAKDLSLMDHPLRRGFASALVEHAEVTFPWVPLALYGAITAPRRARFVAAWWALGLATYTGWSGVYGAVRVPLEVPLALLVVVGIEGLSRGSRRADAGHERGLALVVIIAGVLVLSADAGRHPWHLVTPAYDRPRWLDDVDVPTALSTTLRWARRAAIAAPLLTVLWARFQRETPPAPSGTPGPSSSRPWWCWSLVAALLALAWGPGGSAATARSVRTLAPALDRFEDARAALQLSEPLGTYRVGSRALRAAIRDRPIPTRTLETRALARRWLDDPSVPRLALVERDEVPALYAIAAREEHPVFVIDRTHPRAWLVSNRLPPGATDQSPIPTVLRSEVPPGGTPTSIQFGDALELLSWHVEGSPAVGETFTLRLVFRALKRLPNSARITARLKRGRISRINERPQRLVDGVYPSNLWRYGDIIVHEAKIEVPRFAAVPGAHDLIVTITSRDKKPLSARLRDPDGDRGDLSPPLRILGSKKEKVVLGTINVGSSL